eukprot:gene18753-25283_t
MLEDCVARIRFGQDRNWRTKLHSSRSKTGEGLWRGGVPDLNLETPQWPDSMQLGSLRLSSIVAEAWQCAINCSLRWSPRARNRYLHCAMLLQCNDFGQLQAIMRTFPELHDDDADVRRITDTFKLSANPAGLMDESMCEAMLASFGLDMESAMQISNGLHFDENGNIGFEALKSWYLGIQRMLKNIALMARLLDRLGEWVMADIFRQHDITFNTGARLGDPAAQLPAPHARGGDWGPALELAAEKALDGDLYGANKTL